MASSLLVYWLDRLTGVELSFDFFYLVPVVTAAFSGSMPLVWLFAAIDALLGQISIEGDFEPWILLWNSATRMGLLLVLGGLVVQVNQLLVREIALARHDPLTGLLNRRGLDEVLGAEASVQERSPRALAIVAFDLDRFKQLNDSQGHAVGDRVLKELARAGLAALRPSDCLARVGGDEFVVLLKGTDARASVDSVLRFQVSVVEAFRQQGWSVGLTAGVALWSGGPPPWMELQKEADQQLYFAKASGRGRVALAGSLQGEIL